MPIDTRVSMVNAPCRRLIAAARWKGQPPHTTTGAARVSESHCQLVNCSAGIMAIAITGTDRTAEMITRWRRLSTRSGAALSSVVLSSVVLWPVALWSPALLCVASAALPVVPAGVPAAPGAGVLGRLGRGRGSRAE